MRRERRKWSPGEDSLLQIAVNKATQESRPLLWREIAKSVPDRTNKDCRRRWCNTLANSTTRGSWTESEDERLCTAIGEHGPKWTRVAAAVGTRNSDQCSSHWSQSLNPDINYSDWTRDEDEKVLLAVQQFGTNWSTIASMHVPKRTTLALKNRYSALHTKANQAQTSARNESKLKTRSSTAGSEDHSNQPNPRASKPFAMNGVEADIQTDEDDEDESEDQEDNNDEDEAMDTGDIFDMDWQEIQPARPAATQRQTPSTHTANGPSAYYSPALSDAQHHLNSHSENFVQWNEGAQDREIHNSTFPSRFGQSDYSNNYSHMSLSNDGSASSVSLNRCQYPYKPSLPRPPISAPRTLANPTADTHMDGTSCTSRKDLISTLANGNNSPPASWPKSPPRASAAQMYQQQGHSSPIRSQSMMDQQQEPDFALQDYSSSANSEAPDDTIFALPSPKLTPPSIKPLDLGDGLHHVSIDAVCTTEQLGKIMQSVVGLAKLVTVKVKS